MWLRAGLIAGWVWTLWPGIAATDLITTSHTLSAMAVVGWLLVMPKVAQSDQIKHWVLLGTGAGVAALLNPMLLLLFPASYAWMRQKYAAIAISVMALILVPWTTRNYVELHSTVPLRDNFGLELFLGNHFGMDEHSQPCASKICAGTADYVHADFPSRDPKLFAELGEVEFMEHKRREAVAYIRAYPGKFAWRSAKRLASFWILPYPIICGSLGILAWIGVVRSRMPLRAFLLIMLGVFPAVYYVTQISWLSSYRHPLEPLMILSAASLFGKRKNNDE